MPDLKRISVSLGLENVSTYIQSGNLVFESAETNPAIIGRKIAAGIEKTLGMDVRVIVRDQEELKGILDSNPFIIDRNEDTEKLYVTFLSYFPENIAVMKTTAAGDGGESSLLIDSDSRVVISEGGGGSLNGISSSGNSTFSKDSGWSPQQFDSDGRVEISEEGSGSVKEFSSSGVSKNSGDEEGSNKKPGHNWHGINDKDEFIICGKEIYLFCPNGYGRTKFSNTFFERKLGVSATTRNWKTVKALCEMAMQR